MLHYRLLFLISLIITLTSCSHFYGENGLIKNRDTDYLHAKNEPPLRMPPGISSTSIQSNYPVPEGQYPQSQKTMDLTPPGLNNPGK